MNILFILGNGFDLNLGIKTSYSNFYEYYKLLDSKSILIKKLKDYISSEPHNWSDLELSLGKFTKEIKDLSEFDDVFDDISFELFNYLSEQIAIWKPKKINNQKFIEDLISPTKYLLPLDNSQMIEFSNNWVGNQWRVNIMTFNYTETAELILENIKNKDIGKHHNANVVVFGEVLHIHGNLDKRMIMGVNEKSQIENKDLRELIDVQEALVKPIGNQISKQGIDSTCKFLVNSAQLICIFGSSIGETDRIWWEHIGEQLNRNVRIIIFSKGDVIDQRLHHKYARKERQIVDSFLSKTNLTEIQKEEAKAKIFVSYNSKIFDDVISF